MVTGSSDFYSKAPPDEGASSFIYPPTQANIDFFAKALISGCLVSIPTETVYGLAGIASNESACRSIFEVKGRPLVDPLIVHVASPSMAGKLAELNEVFQILADRFWPGPLTFVLRKKNTVSDLITAGKPTVAIRMPDHPVTLKLINALQKPLAAPSANPFGYLSPTRAKHVADSFGPKVPFIIDGGDCKVGLESTILDITNPDHPEILRPGAITGEKLSAVLDIPVHTRKIHINTSQTATAPGTFTSHYSPITRLLLFQEGSLPAVSGNEAIVFLRREAASPHQKNSFWLSEDNSLKSAANSLYALLRNIDKRGYSAIHCEFPNSSKDSYADAIRDRLSRAAAV